MERLRQRITARLGNGFVLATILVMLLSIATIQPATCEQTRLQQANSSEESTAQPTSGSSSSQSPADIPANQTTTTTNDLEELTSVLSTYVNEALDRNFKEIVAGLTDKLPPAMATPAASNVSITADARGLDALGLSEFDRKILRGLARLIDRRLLAGNTMARAVQTGRLFFFKGLKKIVWPLLFGLQIVKTVLLVLFLPSIIGSLGKIVGKGLGSVSGLSHPAATVEDLDFKDNSYNSDQDFQMNMENNAYLPPLDSHPSGTSYNLMYDNPAGNNGNALSRLGFGGGRVTYVNSANDRQQKRNDFKIFHDIPSSSLLLTNYDPFYSPLLSRLDAVFAQMGLSSKEEACREKLVCLMYANPAKYAPYSNLISAQLSRELNELRKPTNDNPDILRFFKYMRSAKDGQDGVDCDRSYKECSGYKDLSNPAMVTTFNDINKLVLARKL